MNDSGPSATSTGSLPAATPLPRLGPAWQRGGHKGGFQPPPAVPSADSKDGSVPITNNGPNNGRSRSYSERNRSGSTGGSSVGSGGGSLGVGSNVNSFSAFYPDGSDDEPQYPPSPGKTKDANLAKQRTNSRSDALLGSTSGGVGGVPVERNSKPNFQRSLSTGTARSSASASAATGKPGRKLSDLAESFGVAEKPANAVSRAVSVGGHREREGCDWNKRGERSVGRPVQEESNDFKSSIRYTREKLLALRPDPTDSDGSPAVLKHMDGSSLLSDEAQDPGKLTS